MIILLNGPFGVGKTSVATALLSFLRGAHLYDPEVLGRPVVELTQGVRRDSECSDDFQDIRLWELLLVDTARHLIDQYVSTLIVPMTFDDVHRLQRVQNGLQAFSEVHHICLRAPYEIILQRLEARGEHNGDWPQRRAKECCDRQHGEVFETYLDTSDRSIQDIVEEILTRVNS